LRLGVTAADIAGRLREIVGEAIRWSREDVRNQGGVTIGQFHVRIQQWMGFQECPWHCEDEPRWASIDFTIKNLRSGETLEGPGLIVHLIDKHGFFEGRESPYRVDPAQAAKVLELSSGSGFQRR
jgi:hypothetical protein